MFNIVLGVHKYFNMILIADYISYGYKKPALVTKCATVGLKQSYNVTYIFLKFLCTALKHIFDLVVAYNKRQNNAKFKLRGLSLWVCVCVSWRRRKIYLRDVGAQSLPAITAHFQHG